jgi:signal transduction histidine kinase
LALGEADGMLSSECNGGDNQPAGCKDRQGRIWFPTAKGVVVIDPKHVHRNDVPPPVVIEQVKADDQVVFGDGCVLGLTTQNAQGGLGRLGESAGDSPKALNGQRDSGSDTGAAAPPLRLGPGRARVLEIHYTANTLSMPERARFKYRLDGYDLDWRTDDANRRVAFYTNLRPGTYTFRVTACNNHGAWNAEGARFIFSIAPHLYETGPFYGFCGLMAVSAAFGIHHSRVRGINRLRRLEQQHALDLERSRIARDIHDDLGSRFLRISVLGELSERNLPNPGQCRPCLEKLRATTREAFEALDEIVWAANPKHDSVAGLVTYLREYVPQSLSPAGIPCRLDFASPVPELPLGTEVRHHLFLAVKEALQNVVKHAQATEVSVRLELENGTLALQVKDNGRGFDLDAAALNIPPSALGNGLDNMRERMAQAGGRFAVRSAPGQGTEISLRVPLPLQ